MSMARRVKWFLDAHHIEYELVHHAHSSTARESARAAHVPDGRVVKCVLLEDERGYVMAVLPASGRVDLDAIDRELDRHLELASEAELAELFEGCEVGAVPPLGEAYNIPTTIDQSLMRLPDVYFEGGDHEELVHVSGPAFRDLLAGSRQGHFARPH